LRLVERSRTGHLVEVLLPEEIRACSPRRDARPGRTRSRYYAYLSSGSPVGRKQASTLNLEGVDFLRTRALRQSIHTPERGRCFYCLRRLTQAEKCLDHVVPRARSGPNSYRNLVSSCVQCNSLYRERTLTAAELKARLRALDALAAGKLPPPIASTCRGALERVPREAAMCVPGQACPPGGPANPFPRKGRPRKSSMGAL
jgi:5-methylcytosine-specific restriction endonuclease McrA